MKNIQKIISLATLLTIIFVPFQAFASTIPITPALFETSLSFPEATTDTSFTLVSNALQTGVLPAGYTCFTIDQGQSNIEFECGTVSGTTVSNLIRGIDPITGNSSDSSLIFSHRRGADVKITDFPTLTVLSRILSQQDTLAQPITYANGVSPVSGQDLTTKAYVLSVVNGGPITYNQVIVTGTAGTTVAAGNLIYLNTTSGQWDLVTASTTSTFTQVETGIAQGAGTVGNAITGGVLIKGVDLNNTGTAGHYAYAQNTAGTIGSSAGTNTFVVGQFITGSGGLYFDPTFYTTPSAGQYAALAGSSGTPGSGNKYVTQNSLTATPVSGDVPKLDTNGFVPIILLGNSSVYITGNSTSTPANGGTITITHNLGVIPKEIDITTYGAESSNISTESTGVATIVGTTPSYNTIETNNNNTNVSNPTFYTDRIIDGSLSGIVNGAFYATIGSITSSSFVITFTKQSQAITSWSYIIKVIY